MEQSEPTISSILLELADEYSGIVPEREVFERVLMRRPSQAKDPYASIRNKLRYDAVETGWVRLGGGELIPRKAALQGLRFRVIPSEEEYAGDMLSRVWLIRSRRCASWHRSWKTPTGDRFKPRLRICRAARAALPSSPAKRRRWAIGSGAPA